MAKNPEVDNWAALCLQLEAAEATIADQRFQIEELLRRINRLQERLRGYQTVVEADRRVIENLQARLALALVGNP